MAAIDKCAKKVLGSTINQAEHSKETDTTQLLAKTQASQNYLCPMLSSVLKSIGSFSLYIKNQLTKTGFAQVPLKGDKAGL